ncbi:MAG: hypothetical protein AAF389_02645 [Gemmatimonadota bacterium]
MTGRRLARIVGGLIVLAVLADPVVGQERVWTPGTDWTWSVRRDDGAGGDPIRIESDSGGWTLSTGASSILFRDGETLVPPYRIEVDFEGTDPMRRNEGYGIVFGGRDLGGPGQAYGYVLIRQDGMLLVKRRDGDETFVVEDWSRVESLRAWADRESGADTVRNRLAIVVGDDRVRVEVNGVEVVDVPTGAIPVDGMVGLRVNHGLRIGVTGVRMSGG